MRKSISVETSGEDVTELHVTLSFKKQEDGDVYKALANELVSIAQDLQLELEDVE